MKNFSFRDSLYYLSGLILIAQFLMLFFVPLLYYSLWLEFLAWAFWIAGIVFLFLPIDVLRRKGLVTEGSFYSHTQQLVDSSVYGMVRHPQYLGWIFMYISLAFFRIHWVNGLLGLLGVICVAGIAQREDQQLLEKFGDQYREYMQKVPRLNFLLGAVRYFKRKSARRE